jgi:dolichol-phosphate mannosyltransferase
MSASPEVAPDGLGHRVWIALPTYNERDNLEPMVSRLLEVVPAANILVVDDNSPDGTGEIADRLAATDRRVRVLHRAGKEGLGAAYRAAFGQLCQYADCDVVIQIDCDFSHDPADVPRLLAELEAGADLAIGSRYVKGGDTPGWGLGRRLISRGGSTFARTVLGLPLRDLTGGFKAWRTDVLRSIDLDAVGTQGYGFQIEMTWVAYSQGHAVREIPIKFTERRAGQSKMSRRIIAEALLMVIQLRRRRGLPPRVGESSSADLGARQLAALRLVDGTGGVGVDDLGPATGPADDRPAGGGLAAHRAGQAEPRG